VLKDILARLGGDDLTRAGTLIGRTAEFDSSVSGLSADRPAEWRWSFARAPQSLTAEILDSSGTVVARPTVALDASGTLQWDGRLADGSRAPDGAYVLRLSAKDSAGTPLAADMTSLGRIQEVMSREGELWAGFGSVALPLAKLVRIAA
jgi:flagellar basal-body rod modification protein FlgD